MATLQIWIDGGCERNGEEDARCYGSVRMRNPLTGEDITYRRKFPFAHTKYQAEYSALLAAFDLLRPIQDYIGSVIEIRTDSQLVYGQIELGWKIKSSNLVHLAAVSTAHLKTLRNVWGMDVKLFKVAREEIVRKLGH